MGGIAERRRKRQKLYSLLAAMHAGELGHALLPQVKRLAEDLLDVDSLPPVATPPPTGLYRWAYGYCPGNPTLGCPAASPSGCLPARLNHLAVSAGKGAAKRRRDEAVYLRTQLVPCLETALQMVEVDGFRDLILLTRAIAVADADYLAAHAAP